MLSDRQLEEVMVDFWENHFNVFSGKDRVRYYLPEFDTQVIRPRALGFRDLLGAVAHSGAMLYYLDNWQSVADSGRPVLQPPRAAARPASAPASVQMPVECPHRGARDHRIPHRVHHRCRHRSRHVDAVSTRTTPVS